MFRLVVSRIPVRGWGVSRLGVGRRALGTEPATDSSAPGTIGSVDIIYSEEHMEMRKALKKLIDKEINPYVDQWEAEKQFPAHQVMKKLGEAGFLGIGRPTEYGGLGLDYSYCVAFAEELGGIRCGGVPMAIGVQTDMATPALARFGTHELKEKFLAPTIAGDMVVCLGVSEPGAGSDVASIQTRAEKKGDDYIINGSKVWITNGHQADWTCLLVNTGDGPAHKNKSLICVPLDTKGVTRGRKIDKLGMHSSDTAELFFEDVRVPQSHLIGQEGAGFMYQMLQFQEERLFVGAGALLPLDSMIADTIEYTRGRKIFGKSVLDNQVVHFRLAELQTEVELLRSLLYRATALYVQGQDATRLASMVKLKAGRLVREVSDACLQYYGGMGFTTDMPISRYYRDTRLGSIGGGADEVMLSVIRKLMNTLPSRPKGRRIDKLGMHSSDTAELFFEDVRVPQSYLIGQEGAGFMYQMLQFQEERLFAGAGVLLSLDMMITDTIEYTRGRKIFGKSVLDNQVVHFRLAELQTEVELLRSLVYRATALYVQGQDATRLASMVKLKAGRLLREVSDACLQYYGGMGFTTDMPISRYYRDTRLLSIGGGADEVMLSIIAKFMGTLPK